MNFFSVIRNRFEHILKIVFVIHIKYRYLQLYENFYLGILTIIFISILEVYVYLYIHFKYCVDYLFVQV